MNPFRQFLQNLHAPGASTGSLFVLGMIWLLLAACAPAEVTPPTATPTAAPPSATTDTPTPAVRSTLPPTWTPTHTTTPPPPSLTPTPTLTPTVTPTLDDAGRCANLTMIEQPEDHARLIAAVQRSVVFMWTYPVPGESSTLRIVHTASGQGRALTMPGPQSVIAALPLRVLYGPGGYTWRLTPDDRGGSPVTACAVEGQFTILLRDRTTRTDRSGPMPLDDAP
jgi:hypothetical protein